MAQSLNFASSIGVKPIALIADAFPPMRTSASVQLRDLSFELAEQGYEIVILLPSSDINVPWVLEKNGSVQVLRLRSPKTKDIGYVKRTFNETLMPFFMLINLRRSPFANTKWGGVIWYSPTIFFGPMVRGLVKSSSCKSYLILRDIFPEWAVDMGLMRRGVPYKFFKFIERYQYSIADVIGVQTFANMSYFETLGKRISSKTEVLQNWLSHAADVGSSINIQETPLANRKLFVYAGNMGIAQGMDIFLDLAESVKHRTDIGFLFVGRGSDVPRLRQNAIDRKLANTLFYDEISPREIPGLYSQCHAGLIALDQRHKTHNIPGKFLSYIQAGLPVLACINPGNDLELLVNENNLGRVCTDHSVFTLKKLLFELLVEIEKSNEMPSRCKRLSDSLFSTKTAALQIISGLNSATG